MYLQTALHWKRHHHSLCHISQAHRGLPITACKHTEHIGCLRQLPFFASAEKITQALDQINCKFWSVCQAFILPSNQGIAMLSQRLGVQLKQQAVAEPVLRTWLISWANRQLSLGHSPVGFTAPASSPQPVSTPLSLQVHSQTNLLQRWMPNCQPTQLSHRHCTILMTVTKELIWLLNSTGRQLQAGYLKTTLAR